MELLNIEIISAEKKDKPVLRQLLEFYCYDFSEYLGTDVNEHGNFDYKYLDAYWLEAGRVPYFIVVNGKYAGFILLNKAFKMLTDPKGYAVAEFFVMRGYRRKGIGEFAAKEIFNLYPGAWEVSQVMINPVAVSFWNRVVDAYTNGDFTKTVLAGDTYDKQVLIFKN